MRNRILKSIIAVVLTIVFTFTPVSYVIPQNQTITMVQAATVKISAKKLSLTVGQSKILKIKGTKTKVSWSTNKKKVATVTKKGKVTAKKVGTAKITAKVRKKKYTCKVTVKKKKVKKKKVTTETPTTETPTTETPTTETPTEKIAIPEFPSGGFSAYYEVSKDSTDLNTKFTLHMKNFTDEEMQLGYNVGYITKLKSNNTQLHFHPERSIVGNTTLEEMNEDIKSYVIPANTEVVLELSNGYYDYNEIYKDVENSHLLLDITYKDFSYGFNAYQDSGLNNRCEIIQKGAIKEGEYKKELIEYGIITILSQLKNPSSFRINRLIFEPHSYGDIGGIAIEYYAKNSYNADVLSFAFVEYNNSPLFNSNRYSSLVENFGFITVTINSGKTPTIALNDEMITDFEQYLIEAQNIYTNGQYSFY